MTELENKILEAANQVPATYGDYRLIKELRFKIANIMGYKVWTMAKDGSKVFDKLEDYDKVSEIMRRMSNKGYIRFSKSGQAYKVL